MNNDILQISHQNLKTGTLIKISNPKNKESKNPKTLTKKTQLKSFGKINLKKGPASFSEKALKIVGAFKAD